jgi:hypothetical protein
MATQVLETQVLRRQAEGKADRDDALKIGPARIKVVGAGVAGLVLGLCIAIAVVYFLPQIYMGTAFGKPAMTKSEVIRSLEYGRNIHVFYAAIPWPKQTLVGSQEFHRSWIRTYDEAIGYLEK